MKKAAIIVCAVIYALSIILVAFLGYKAEMKNPPIYADDIVLSFKTPYQKIENGAIIYQITDAAPQPKIQAEEEDPEATKKVYKYQVRIMDFDYFYNVCGGEINVKCTPISNKVDPETNEQKVPDELGLNYSISDKTIAKSSKEGVVKFNAGLDLDEHSIGAIDLVVKTKDTSNITIYIQIFWTEGGF